MDWSSAPELVAAGGALGLLTLVVARLLMDEGPRRTIVKDLRDSLKECRESKQALRERADMEEHMRRLWQRRAHEAGWVDDDGA